MAGAILARGGRPVKRSKRVAAVPCVPGVVVDTAGNVWEYEGRGWLKLSTYVDKDGYTVVEITADGKSRRWYVHRLVLMAFVGMPEAGMEACHNNGIRTDCRLENLRWDTRRGNHADMKLHGTSQEGMRHGAAKLTEVQVIEMRRLYKEGRSKLSLSKEFGVSPSQTSRIVHRKRWTHLP